MISALTRFAVLTPNGVGAVATIVVVGPDAWNMCRAAIRRADGRQFPKEICEAHAWTGEIGLPPGETVIVAARQLDTTPCVEIHCHGGLEVIRYLGHELTRQGAAETSAAEMVRPLSIDGIRALAARQLTLATTRKTAALLLDQFQGALSRAIEAIAVNLDSGNTAEAGRLIAALQSNCSVGRHLVTPWRVVVAGAPNVGKSSLINYIAGHHRCIVAPAPGTTRDLVSTFVAIDGWPVELVDTAGQHETSDKIEVQGIARARAEMARADLCLWVVDSSKAPKWVEHVAGNTLIVVNKIDIPAAWPMPSEMHAARISALTGAGVDELCQRISAWLIPIPPRPGEAIPFTPELCDRIDVAASAFEQEDLVALRSVVAELLAFR